MYYLALPRKKGGGKQLRGFASLFYNNNNNNEDEITSNFPILTANIMLIKT